MGISASFASSLAQSVLQEELTKTDLVAVIEPWLEEALKRAVARSIETANSPANVLKQQCLEILAPDLVHGVFSALLGREPEAEAVLHYTDFILERGGIGHMLKVVSESEECRHRLRANLPALPHPALTQDQPAAVFLHIQKTGGTSLQNMFSDAFDERYIYREHADTLYLRSPAELAQYNIFLGHFNYDSIVYIPKSDISLITFLREPKARLISLYKFWRAHEPEHPSFHEGMKLANQLSIEDFFRAISSNRDAATLNHIVWVVMGERSWIYWHGQIEDAGADHTAKFAVLEAFRRAARERLEEFFFVGMQEDFTRSTEMLAKLFGNPAFKPRHDHAVDALLETEPLFKKSLVIDSVSYGSVIDDAINVMTQLDSIVYEEASKIYSKRFKRDVGVEGIDGSNDLVPVPGA